MSVGTLSSNVQNILVLAISQFTTSIARYLVGEYPGLFPGLFRGMQFLIRLVGAAVAGHCVMIVPVKVYVNDTNDSLEGSNSRQRIVTVVTAERWRSLRTGFPFKSAVTVG